MSTPTTPRGRRARQGYRIALTGAILLPMALVVAMGMALSAGFCSDWGDEQTCADQRRSGVAISVFVIAVPVGLLIWGLVRHTRNRPARSTLAATDRRKPASRTTNRKAVVALALSVAGWILTVVGSDSDAALLVWLVVGVACPFPSLVLAWQARTEIRESAGNQRGVALAWAATAITVALLLLGIIRF